jgi:hypothetical protein
MRSDYRTIHERGMEINSGNRRARTKPSTASLRPPQIPHDLTWDGNWSGVVGYQRLNSRSMARFTNIQWGLTVWKYQLDNEISVLMLLLMVY